MTICFNDFNPLFFVWILSSNFAICIKSCDSFEEILSWIERNFLFYLLSIEPISYFRKRNRYANMMSISDLMNWVAVSTKKSQNFLYKPRKGQLEFNQNHSFKHRLGFLCFSLQNEIQSDYFVLSPAIDYQCSNSK